MLRDVGAVSSAVELLGSSLDSPVGVAPVAMQALAHPDGELATARAAREAGSLLVLSTRSTVPLEQVAAVAGPWWFQVYAMRERRLSLALATRAADAGATALVLTGDTPYVA
ncbi:MAG: L-lactate dehydrogenase, partial [Frankiales bacterium]|nr:L-lactate dehydrogenase [Frankiales bacterium]